MRVPMSATTPEFWGEQEDQSYIMTPDWIDYDNPQYCDVCDDITNHIELPDKPYLFDICEVCYER